MNIKQFIINRKRVEAVLRFLCKNNQAYIQNNITIDESAFQSLPEDGVPNDLNFVDDTECTQIDNIFVDSGPNIEVNSQETNNNVNDQYEAFIEGSEDQPLQIDNIRTSINFPKANTKAINEFQIDSICSLLFPKLFPTGTADPTDKGNFYALYIFPIFIFK